MAPIFFHASLLLAPLHAYCAAPLHAWCLNSCSRWLRQVTHIATCTTSRSTFETSKWNNYDIRTKQLKYSRHASETHIKTHEKTLKKQIANIQHSDKTLVIYEWNICNIQINTLTTYVLKH
jgi:hypothetical protein